MSVYFFRVPKLFESTPSPYPSPLRSNPEVQEYRLRECFKKKSQTCPNRGRGSDTPKLSVPTSLSVLTPKLS